MFTYLEKQSKTLLTALSFFLILFLGVLDYLTGSELSFSVFYLIPISIGSWLVNKRLGAALSVTSAIIWFTADMLTHPPYSNPTIPYWNSLTRLAFFLVVTYTLSELQAIQRKQEELIHFIVHDLRSPLSIILMGLDLLNDETETLSEKQRLLIQGSTTAGNRMLVLINSLLDLAQLESGRMPIVIQPVEVAELASTAVKQIEIGAIRSQISLVTNLPPEPCMVQADKELTIRVLVNLLSNALKFSDPGSTITLSASPADSSIIFRVSDEGVGVPKEWANRVFDKFAQVEARQKGAKVGSGLGLNFCRLAVEAQQGHIWLESDAGKGTTITFTLPVVKRGAS